MRTAVVYLVAGLIWLVAVCGANPLYRTILNHPSLAQRAGISGSQMEELESAFASAEQAIIASRAEAATLRVELGRVLRSDEPDLERVRAIVREIGGAKAEAASARIERNLRMRRILTREQIQQVRRAVRASARMQRAGRAGAMRSRGPERAFREWDSEHRLRCGRMHVLRPFGHAPWAPGTRVRHPRGRRSI